MAIAAACVFIAIAAAGVFIVKETVGRLYCSTRINAPSVSNNTYTLQIYIYFSKYVDLSVIPAIAIAHADEQQS